jgi:hypothetical protein
MFIYKKKAAIVVAAFLFDDKLFEKFNGNVSAIRNEERLTTP